MEENRSNPEEILKEIEKEKQGRRRGQLKIFFGYAPGTGKTYAMLQAARAAKHRGVDVVVGYVPSQLPPQTSRLLSGMEALPEKKISVRGGTIWEFDLDRAIERRAKLVLVDELAHTNPGGCRHQKRYQDIRELLTCGIDVYTTVDVQHLESLSDLVASVTGKEERERIPDEIFDNADQVELVDIEPRELIQRLGEGKIFQKQQQIQKAEPLFTEKILEAMRELALRRCADRVNRMAEIVWGKAQAGMTDEHVLVCLSSAPSNPKIVRTAARLARAFRGTLTALFVETPDEKNAPEEEKKRLREHIRLAEQLGATVETVAGDDLSFQIAEFARVSGVSKIVLGRSSTKRGRIWRKPSISERITQMVPNLDIYVIPDYKDKKTDRRRKSVGDVEKIRLKDILKCTGILLAATGVCLLFRELGFFQANMITIYILAVLLIAVVTPGRGYSLISSVISVLLFNFFFTEPLFTLNAYGPEYPVTFVIMFISAFITSSVTVRMKKQMKQAAQTAYRTRILFDTNQELSNEKDESGMVRVTCRQLNKLLQRDIVFYRAEDEKLQAPEVFWKGAKGSDETFVSDKERSVADWVRRNNKHAGATTETFGEAKCLYLSVRVRQEVYGVVGIPMDEGEPDTFENSILLSILGECALAMRNARVSREREEAALLAKNEQLRANLLRSISHDLRTPLTSISGNAGILLANEAQLSSEKRRALYTDIYEDSLWLINLVENLLSVTRIENGTMELRMSVELLSDIIAEAAKHVNCDRGKHHLHVEPEDEFCLVKADARLLMQTVINLVDNAVKYTPAGSNIWIRTRREGDQVIVAVEDDGNGVPEKEKEHIFDMFYTAQTKIADSRRSLGLGLALCKSIVAAHGGKIWVEDRPPHGASFQFQLPVEEVTLHE